MDPKNWRVQRELRRQGLRRNDIPPSGRSHPYRGTRSANVAPVQPDPVAELAIDQGRRLYVGNLPYEAKLADIQSLFIDIQHAIQDIIMSVDPMTGRNPSYCFIEVATQDVASSIIENYNGRTFMNRVLKVKPGVKPRQRPQNANDSSDRRDCRSEVQGTTASPYAFNRWRRLDAQVDTEILNKMAIDEGRRLYVGGLPQFPSQAEHNLQIRDLFKEHRVEVVSKMILPHYLHFEKHGNGRYCFVDVSSREDADNAIKTLNGTEKWNHEISVCRSRSNRISGKLHQRQRVYVAGFPLLKDDKALRDELSTMFQPFGKIMFASMMMSTSSKSASNDKGYCFIEFSDVSQADAAIAALDQTNKWDGIVTVRHAKPSKQAGHTEPKEELEEGEASE